MAAGYLWPPVKAQHWWKSCPTDLLVNWLRGQSTLSASLQVIPTRWEHSVHYRSRILFERDLSSLEERLMQSPACRQEQPSPVLLQPGEQFSGTAPGVVLHKKLNSQPCAHTAAAAPWAVLTAPQSARWGEIMPLLSTCGAASGYWWRRITVNVSPTQEQVARRGCRIMSFRILTDPLDVTLDNLL